MCAHILTPQPLVINKNPSSQPIALHNSVYRLIDPWNILDEGHTFSLVYFCWCFGSAVTPFPWPTERVGLKASVLSLHTHQWESRSDPSPVKPVFITKQLLQPTRHIPHILQQTGATGVTGHLTLSSSLVSVVRRACGCHLALQTTVYPRSHIMT